MRCAKWGTKDRAVWLVQAVWLLLVHDRQAHGGAQRRAVSVAERRQRAADRSTTPQYTHPSINMPYASLMLAAVMMRPTSGKRSPFGDAAITPFGGRGTYDSPLLIDVLEAADVWPNGVKSFEVRARQIETKMNRLVESRPWDSALRAFARECTVRVWSLMGAEDIVSLNSLHKCLYHGVLGVMRNVCRQLTSEASVVRTEMAPQKHWNLFNYTSGQLSLYKAEVFHEGRGRLGMYPYRLGAGLRSGSVPEKIMEDRSVPCQVFDTYDQEGQPKEINEDVFIGITLALEERAGRTLRHVCEVGVMSGGTGMGALSGTTDSIYHGHDLFFKASSGPIQTLLSAFFGRRRTRFVPGHFFDTAPLLRRDYRPCDFFYIDGGHDRYSAMLDFVALATAPAHISRDAIVMFDDWHVQGVAQDIKDLARAGYIKQLKWYRGVPRPGKVFRGNMVGYTEAFVDGKFAEFQPGISHRDKTWCTARYTGKIFDNTTNGPIPIGPGHGGGKRRGRKTYPAWFPFKQDVGL